MKMLHMEQLTFNALELKIQQRKQLLSVANTVWNKMPTQLYFPTKLNHAWRVKVTILSPAK